MNNTKNKRTLDSLFGEFADGLREVADVIETTAKNVGDEFAKTYDTISDRVADFPEFSAKKVEDAFDKVLANEKVYDILSTAYESAKKGKDEVTQALRKKYDACQSELDSYAKTKPEVAGFIDGYLNIMLATPANRRPRSAIYNQHVKYGKVAAVGTSFLPIGALRLVSVGAPLLSHASKYFHEKFEDAKEEVKAKSQ
jgi:hypothetical protein